MDDQNEKIKLNKAKILTVSITISLTILFTTILVGALVIVVRPILKTDIKSSNNTNSAYLKRIEYALDEISEKYVEDVDMDTLVNGAISGIANATGDPYTRYISEEEYQEMLDSSVKPYSGIGVHLTFDTETSGIEILGIMPDSPATKVDLKIGDIILKVEDITVSLETYQDCVDAIKGEAGTSVKLVIKRGDELLEREVVRESIVANNIESEILDGNIGYIKIWQFDNGIYEQFKTEYNKLRDQNIKGLVIDVRNNPGGLVSDTLNIARLMLPKCELLKLVYKDGSEKVYECDGKHEIDIPLVILVNSRSASASEILSGAIKDSGKGIVIGTTTYGKGIVQTIEPLGNNGALSITTSKYYTSSGVEIHKKGIEPNIVVELPEEVKNDLTIVRDKDTQLNEAINYINSKN
ncbi:MAG: S41 family peptidase [Clostridia bacterium]|nr:S41 family peptidase [Clostridia bacterium]